MWHPVDDAVDAHLERIGLTRPGAASVDALAELQLAHLLHVPFENLDIHLGVDIVLDPSSIHDKVVTRRRGGYCYELNSAAAGLLGRLGFEVAMVSARVMVEGGLGPEFDHMTLLVDVPDTPTSFLVDVGFGDAFRQPIPLVDGAERPDRDKRVRVRRVDGGGRWAYDEHRGADWSTQYVFDLAPRSLDEFAEMNEWQQRSPDSHFRQSPVCSLLTRDGRITVSGDRLITTRTTTTTTTTTTTASPPTPSTASTGDDRSERTLTAAERMAVLRESFGIELDRTL